MRFFSIRKILTDLGIRKGQWIRGPPDELCILETLPKTWPHAGKAAVIDLQAVDTLKILRLYDLADETFPAQRNDERVTALATLAGIPTSSIDTDSDDADAITEPIDQGTDALSMCHSIET